MPATEPVFTIEATPVKFGAGAVDDLGWEAQRLLTIAPTAPSADDLAAIFRASMRNR